MNVGRAVEEGSQLKISREILLKRGRWWAWRESVTLLMGKRPVRLDSVFPLTAIYRSW
jgi:hypothetical protein